MGEQFERSVRHGRDRRAGCDQPAQQDEHAGAGLAGTEEVLARAVAAGGAETRRARARSLSSVQGEVAMERACGFLQRA